ncbi:MAG: L,D-transpeptidase family protein [Dissulfurispiraceae bacterium]|jgi:L,D-transpeptidase ErfK/SrfK|nr:L,D-transpeptidase family protein [Dissulfurispiraceae bacterium]
MTKSIVKYMTVFLASFLLILFSSGNTSAQTYALSSDDSVIGINQHYTVAGRESLIEVARKYGIGFNSIHAANRTLDEFIPGDGSEVLIPTSFIIPDEKKSSIIINLSEMRLYYFFSKGKSRYVSTFPIGIGTDIASTPTGTFKISHKTVNPSWYVPLSVQEERPELPKIVPPGPENPLGTHAMRLSSSSYLIHGTHRPYGVGRRVSHGCIRLYPEHIPQLFSISAIGTKVTIIQQPVKVGQREGRVYISVHDDDHVQDFNYLGAAIGLLKQKNFLGRINTGRLYEAVELKLGYPVDITE